MEPALLALIEYATGQGPAWVLLLIALFGWWRSTQEARAREDALNDKLLSMATDGSRQIFEAVATVREALIHINRVGGGR